MLRTVLTVVLLAAGMVFTTPARAQATARLLPAHSHWDVHEYSNHEIQLCYEPQAQTSSAGKTIAFLPIREKDSQNFMELDIRRDGLRLSRPVSGQAVIDRPTFSTTHTFGVGDEIMLDFTMIGNTFTVYELLPGLARGAKWYQWTDSTFSTGVNISYYTSPGYRGLWDFVHAFPISGGIGQPHDIVGLNQDARAHSTTSSLATFDDPSPAGGGASGIAHSSTFGLPSGSNYTYTVDVTGSGKGYFDFRDPGTAAGAAFFAAGWYRFTPGPTVGPATIRRYTGSGTLARTYTASTGGPGAYTIVLTGPNVSVRKSGATILTVTDPAGNTSGLRVRISPASGQSFAWTGRPAPG